MAFSSKRINAYDVAQMCGVEHDEAAFVLNGLYPIIVCEGDRYFAFHNDVRLFLQNAIIHNSNIKGITESIINQTISHIMLNPLHIQHQSVSTPHQWPYKILVN